MKKLLLLVGLLALPSNASAQCNGVFPNNTVCGNITGSNNLPRPTTPSAFLGAAGGTNGQIQYNNGGALGGFGPITGDITLTVPGGVATIQNKTGNGPNIATSTGSLTSQNCVKIDANGNLVDAGTVCNTDVSVFGAIGYTPAAGNDCSVGAGAAPDDTIALTTAANQSFPVRLAQNRCYKITQTVVMTTSFGGLFGDRSSTIWMPSASFNSTALCSTVNCFTTNALGFYIQGGLVGPFTPIQNPLLFGFRIQSQVADGRAVGAMAVRNAQHANISGLEISGFPVGAMIWVDSVFESQFNANYIHDITTNAVWGSPPQIFGIVFDGSRVNGITSNAVQMRNNRLVDLFFGAVTEGAWTQQTNGLSALSINGGQFVITDNYVNNTGQGIDVYAWRSTISNNIIISAILSAIALKHGASYNVISNNVMYANSLYGMQLSGDSGPAGDTQNNLIIGNNVEFLNTNGAFAANATACFRFEGSGTPALPRANIIRSNYCNASGGKYGIFGDASDGINNFYEDNFIINASTANIAVTSPTGFIVGVSTVAGLPVCTLSLRGLRQYVTDQNGAPTFLGPLTGGGAIVTPVMCNGAAWVAG